MLQSKTKVIFRVYPDQSVIALFPEEVGAKHDNSCLCYQHIGQHGHAHYNFVCSQSRPAKPEEYRDLYQELTSAPFNYEFIVLKRYQPRKGKP